MAAAVDDARAFVEGMTRDDFVNDRKTQQAVIWCLVVIGEAATKVMDGYPEFVKEHQDWPWRAMRGMRNRLAHGYFSINLELVWSTVEVEFPPFREKIRAVQTPSSR